LARSVPLSDNLFVALELEVSARASQQKKSSARTLSTFTCLPPSIIINIITISAPTD
jgi:hypothetical protein